ncbi:MAG: bifunctional DNA-formamidopyrimidine glycosylase/DNA-(apurinic or apyrimidinic site) lyase [Bdellovibrionota bacterium]
MPELPEVDTVRRQLSEKLPLPLKLEKISFSGISLRFPLDEKNARKKLTGQSLKKLSRHGKYLFFEWERGVLISHLGMTGHWRVDKIKDYKAKKHDHVQLYFADLVLTYNDPRRFGYVLWEDLFDQTALKKLGLGPDAIEWAIDDLFIKSMKKKSAPIKAALLDQRIVAGIGNIYASEILFHAGVKPTKKVSAVTRDQWKKIILQTHRILQAAIEGGGSTIDDYLQPDGAKGNFQDSHSVYGKKGNPCPKCKAAIVLSTQSGRSTFWCRKCQR